jgi:uncharacterized protein (TIGR02001 family)
MRSHLAPLVAATLLVPGAAAAQQLSFSLGAAIVSEYEANGLRQSNGIAFQPWVEAGVAGFYAGLWASNVDPALLGAGNTFEYNLYAGYRNVFGALSYDLQYARYLYNGTGDCCGEAIVSLSYGFTDQMSLGTRFAWDPNSGTVNSRLFGSFAVNEQVSLNARYGTISGGGHQYWTLGASYALSDTVSASLAYHGTSRPAPDSSLIVGGVSFAFAFP